MTTREQQLIKYRISDIFNYKPDLNVPSTCTNVRKNLLMKRNKSDIFNIEKKDNPKIKVKKNYLKNYSSDIFNLKKIEPKKINNHTNLNKNFSSSCFKYSQNNIAYKNYLKNYTKIHRPILKEYNPNNYFGNDTSTERYYSQMVTDNFIKNKKLINEINEEKKKFSERRKTQKQFITKKENDIEYSKKNFSRKKIDWENAGFKFIEPEEKDIVNTARLNYHLSFSSNIFDNSELNNKNVKIENNKNTIPTNLNFKIKKINITNSLRNPKNLTTRYIKMEK